MGHQLMIHKVLDVTTLEYKTEVDAGPDMRGLVGLAKIKMENTSTAHPVVH